jgi:AraC family transcriptional regulator, regulatory protein of adaptative response / methylated-DNA-[protein]-cysteine methyltransferase
MQETIRFAWGVSALGDFIVAMSDNGVVALEFSSTRSATEDGLRSRFPNAEFQRAQDEFADLTDLVARVIEDPSIPHTLPIDKRGTSSEIRLWLMLRETPPGHTTTYSALARKFRMRVGISGPIHAFLRINKLLH